MDLILANNETINYALFLLYFTAAIVLGKAVYYIFHFPLRRYFESKKRKFNKEFSDIIEEPLVALMITGGFYFGKKYLILPEGLGRFIDNIVIVVVVILITYTVLRMVDLIIIIYIDPLVKRTKSKLDDQLVPIIKNILKIFIVILGLMTVLDNFGIDITSLLAGLGIGGIALALAAKDALANIFGSITIFTDKPFQVGDIVRFDNDQREGIIEAVGLRSTRLKTWDGTEVIIPNSRISTSVIENVSKRRGIKKTMQLMLDYGNNEKKIDKAISLVEGVLERTKHVDKEFYVTFGDYDIYGMVIYVMFWIKLQKDYGSYVRIKNEVNLGIKREMDRAKIKFRAR